MAKGNGLIIIAAIAAAVVFLPDILKKGEGEEGGISLGGFGTGEMPGFDLSGMFGGLNDMLNGLMSGVSEMVSGVMSGVDSGGGLLPDFAGFWDFLDTFKFDGGGDGRGGAPGTPGAPGGTGWWDVPIIPATGNLPVDWGNAISQTAMSVAKAGLTGLGIYAGAKVAVPVLGQVAPGLARAISTPVGQIAGNVGRGVSAFTKAGSQVFTKGIPALTGYLGTPLSGLGVAGWAGAVPLAAASGYGGYKLGTFLMEHTPLGEVTGRWAESAGASFAKSGLGQKLFGVAQVGNLSSTTQSNFQQKYGISLAQAQKMTTAQLQALIKSKKSYTYRPTPKVTMTFSQEKKAQQNAANAAFLQGMAAMGWK